MREEARITGIRDGVVTVETLSADECGACSSCGAHKPRSVGIRAGDTRGLSVGQNVVIEISPEALLKIYLVLYGVPLLTFMGAILGAYFLIREPLASFVIAFLATMSSYFLIGRYIRTKHEFSPKIRNK